MAVETGTRGLYHADNGDATAEFIRDHGEDWCGSRNVAVLCRRLAQDGPKRSP